MHNFSLRKTLTVAKTEYLKWLLNPRMIIILVMLIFIKTCAIDPLAERSAEMNSPLNLLEPFIAIGNSGVLVLIIPAVFLTLISDFPRTDGNTLLFVMRTGKLNWLAGQIIFAVMSIISFIAAVFVGSIIPIFSNAFWGNGWSLVVKKYDIMFPDKAGGFASELVPGNLYNQLPPFSAAIQTYILLMAYLMILALIMLFFNLIKIKSAGVLTSGGIIAFGVAFCGVKTSPMWLFPMANAIIWLHFTKYYRMPVKPIIYSYLYFIIAVITLISLCVYISGKLNFDCIQEVD